MQNPELAHPHDLLVRRFLTDPEFMADLLRYYPQNPAEQRMVALLDLERLVCKDPVTVKDDPRMGGWLPSLGFYAMSVDDIETGQVEKAFSKIVNKEEAHKMAQTTAEKLWTGGIAEGRAMEKTETAREMLLEFLRGKFGKVPKHIERAINQMNDPIALKSLAVRTGNCKTLAEFAEEL